MLGVELALNCSSVYFTVLVYIVAEMDLFLEAVLNLIILLNHLFYSNFQLLLTKN